jgi:CBS domain containing-hemolysin-like protein
MISGILPLTGAVVLVVLNGFFVAAEFALVKVRRGRIEELVRQNRAFAKTASWLVRHLDDSLSSCQLGITLASLGLGLVGEPAFAAILKPLFHAMGLGSEPVIHTLAFIISFGLITAAHLIVGEQAPKIFAIRQPERVLLWCALPMKLFYLLFYPFTRVLTVATSILLGWVGIDSSSEHDTPHTEEEIKILVGRSHIQGELTPSEHRLINAVFRFDDLLCRQVMMPRHELVFFDVNKAARGICRVVCPDPAFKIPGL